MNRYLSPRIVFFLMLVGAAACAPTPPSGQTALPVTEEVAVPTNTESPPTATNIPPTATEIPTATFTPTVYVPKSGDNIFSTDFSDLESWSVEKLFEDQAGYITEYQSDGLYIVVPEEEDGIWLYYELQPDLGNVRLEADVELIGGTNYSYISLICRSSNEGEYVFTLDTGGYWQIGKWTSSFSDYETLAYGGSTVINVAKAPNHLAAECNGSSLTIFINGEEIKKVEDEEFEKGSVGVGVETFDLPYAEVMIHGLDVIVP